MAKKNQIWHLYFLLKRNLFIGWLYVWNNLGKRNETARPISLIEKSVRGTISNRLDKVTLNDPMKLNAKVERPNPQTVDSASISLNDDTLKLSFTIKVLSGVEHPSACNNETHHKR